MRIADSTAPGRNRCVYETERQILFRDRGHTEYGIPFGQDHLVLLWLATEAIGPRSPVGRFESASQILTDWGLTTGGEYYRRLASSFRRVFGSTIFFGTQSERGRSEVRDP